MSGGKSNQDYQSKMDAWVNNQNRWEARLNKFQVEQDSIRQILNDTTLAISAEDSSSYQALIDSTLEKPDFSDDFPYKGAYWDSARITTDSFLETFQSSDLRPKVERLQNELRLPQNDETEDQMVEGTEPEQTEMSAAEEQYVSCQDLDQSLEVRGGTSRFLEQISIPDGLEINEITYLFRINQRGIIDSYELRSENAPEELTTTFANMFDRGLAFEPILNNGQAVAIECEITFPLEN